ncbi:MAG TPA: NAD(+) synthase [Candidatus Microsaccharimonas sp.]|jgi:NAD+ synthase (glutamine-hydrolysing)
MKTPEMTFDYQPKTDFIRVATATPEVAIGDVSTNLLHIKELYDTAVKSDVALVVFPELSLTGYTIQDLVAQPKLLQNARNGLVALADYTEGTHTAVIVGLPLAVGNAIYNTAAIVSEGKIRGIVPKQNLPTYNEFYEKRWYQTWNDQPNLQITINDQVVPFGRDQLFRIDDQLVGIEICEDLWVPEQPSIELVANGATIIANPSASPEAVAKAQYRRSLIANTAARNVAGYVYASADETESTAEIVMSGHSLISELGTTLAERAPFTKPQRLMIADIDTQHIANDRFKTTNFPNRHDITPTETNVTAHQTDFLRTIDPEPFLPKGSTEEIRERLDTILNIQATGLAMRLRSANIQKVILGLSGGLDSTLALLVAIRAASILGKEPSNLIHTLTMPGVASSDRTQNNAMKLANLLDIVNEEIPIAALADAQLQAIDHQGEEDVTYENTQARIRQALVFNKANQINGLALGTGDLSEIALGWCTYNGDHMSHYNVNASIPKTLVRSLVRHASETLPEDAQTILHDILDTPVSPELTGNGSSISQETEDLVGPYELHDFFLYHFLRWMEPKEKIGFLAIKAFEGRYGPAEIAKWLDVFMHRFYQNQWKRQAMPDGAKVGISLSPKGDWRMAAEAKLV